MMRQAKLYIFNPTCEIAVANGSSTYQAPQILRILEDDLSCLPMFLANPEDYILGTENISKDHLQFLQSINFPTPNYISNSEISDFPDLMFEKLIPWGWSPACHQQLRNIKLRTNNSFQNSKVFSWNSNHRLLYERKSSAEFLKSFLHNSVNPELITTVAIPQQFTSISEIENYLVLQNKIVLKAPLSSSGRGIQMIRKGALTESNKKWIKTILQQQDYVMAEPLWEKITDFSMHFEIEENKSVKYLGYSIFETTPNGMFIGSLLNTPIEELHQGIISSEKINSIGQNLAQHLMNSIYSDYYQGKLGIDAMIVNSDDQLKIHPCVEINSRLNMGIIAKRIEKYIHKNARGRFEIFPDTRGNFQDFAARMQKEHPIKLIDKKVSRGFIPITDPLKSKKFGAFILLN